MIKQRLGPLIALILTILLIVWGSGGAIATTEKAPVALDGQILFRVGESGNFTAKERARTINRILRQEAKQDEPPTVEVDQEDGLTILRADERYILTVTENDLQNAAWPSSQGELWRAELQAALEQAHEQRTRTYQRQAIALMVVMLVASVLLLQGVRRGTARLSKYLMQSLKNPTSPLFPWAEPANFLVRVLRIALQLFVGLACLYLISDRLPQTRIWRYRLYRLWSEPLITVGDGVTKSLSDLVLLILLSLGLWFAISIFSRWFKMYLIQKAGRDSATYELIGTLVQYVLVFLGLLVILPLWGINLASLAILGSFLGVGIGFGVQNIINNFVSGLIIAVERPIKVGDFVTVGEFQGTVTQVGSRSTQIRTLDRVSIIVPNSRFLEQEVINRSHDDPISRLHIPVGVAYGSHIATVRKAILAAATQHREVLLRPEPQVWFMEFGDSSLNFELLVWTSDPKEQPRIKSELNYRIEANFRKYDVEVPFPQRDLHVRSPHLQALIDALLPQVEQPSLAKPPDAKPDATSDLDFLEVAPETSTVEEFSSRDIESLVKKLRGEDGVEISDRRYRFTVYPKCFIGAEAVDWIVGHQDCSREAAVTIGQMLCDRGIIHHISDDHPFRDAYLFYRFYSDER